MLGSNRVSGPLRRWIHRFWWPTISPGEFDGSDCVVVHEWLTSASGSDKVAAELAKVGDAAAVICLASLPDVVEQLNIDVPVHQSRLGSWAATGRRWQFLLPIMPLIWGALDLTGTRTLLTSSHSLVNSIPKVGKRFCYCHTPVRYGWEWRMERDRLPGFAWLLFRPGAWLLRAWDRRVSQRVDVFIANSQFVADRISKFYDRSAVVIHPPVDTDWFAPTSDPKRDEFLVAGRLVPYKRADIAVAAASMSGERLVVAGSGPELDRLRADAGQTVRFVESPSDEDLLDLMQNAKALVHPGIEDFGMMVVEAQACGTPVIARAAGGALESVDESISGQLIDSGSVTEWAEAMRTFNDVSDPQKTREHAAQFGYAVFREQLSQVLEPA